MKRDNENHESIRNLILTGLILCGALALYALLPEPASADETSEYYENLLYHPSASTLAAEARGRVTIYDGLQHRDVDAALNRQFDRIQRMMFVRTRQNLPDGTEEIEDDCD